MNRSVSDSIRSELEDLEAVGRVSVRGQQQVHTGFGFAAMRRDEDAAEEPQSTPEQGSEAAEVAGELDDALTRLRARASIA